MFKTSLLVIFSPLVSLDGPDLWSSIHFQDHSSSDKAEMLMFLSDRRCLLQPNASLCWKESAAAEAVCQDIPNSTVKARSDQVKKWGGHFL